MGLLSDFGLVMTNETQRTQNKAVPDSGTTDAEVIRLVDVYKSFGEHPVLEGLNLGIPRGKLTTIIGRSGGGKSVLLKHMIGLIRPNRGQVLVEGIDIARLGQRELNEVRKKFAMLFQGAALFDSLSVFENVAFPLREKTNLKDEEIRHKVLEILDQVGLNGMEEKYPAQLSGGMRKRAGLARALVLGPEIMLFDEPTTGLDPLLAGTIHELILQTQRRYGFTGVMVSHEIPEVFGISDYVAMLLDGKIAEIAPPDQFVKTQNPEIQEFISGGKPPRHPQSSPEGRPVAAVQEARRP
jgi:phospholipid/cholesterol/gamma-HCH transport system ATP-binding protein